jgi:sugar/nucleoside kinase (ribokinase family)
VSRLVFTVGEALAVFLAEGDGPLANTSRFDLIVTGAEVNMAAGLTQEGHRARIVTRVGDDPLGAAVSRQLEQWGVDARVQRDAARPTGILIRTVGGSDRGEAVHLRRGAAAEVLSADDVDAAWSDDAAAVFVTGITMVRSASAAGAAERAVARARSAGALVVVDPNLRPALADRSTFGVALAPLRGRVDIAVGDPEELALLAGVGVDDGVDALLAAGCRLVVTKLGAEGAMATDVHGRTSHVPSAVQPGEVIDTIGAGDAFTAGLLAGILDGESPEAALERGSRRAATVVRTRGDVAIIEAVH